MTSVSSAPADNFESQRNNTVFIVDDDPLIRASLEIALSLAGFKVVKFASAEQFLTQITRDQFGCALIDVRMPGMNGLELQEQLARQKTGMSVIVMTGHADVPLAVRAIKGGALDILEKPFNNELLVERVSAALSVSHQNAEQLSRRDVVAGRYSELSERERDVFKLVAEGKSNKEVGRILNISPRTAEGHRSHVLKKMKADNLAALIRMKGDVSSS